MHLYHARRSWIAPGCRWPARGRQQRRVVEAPGTAPVSVTLIPYTVYRHSRFPDGRQYRERHRSAQQVRDLGHPSVASMRRGPELVQQGGGTINLGQRLANRHRADDDAAIDGTVIAEIAAERIDIAVEGEPQHIRLGVDHRRAGIAADDVVGRREIEHGAGIEL